MKKNMRMIKVIICLILGLCTLGYGIHISKVEASPTQFQTLMKATDGIKFIDNPAVPTNADAYWNGSYLYLGLEKSDGWRNRWKILQKEGNKLFLLADKPAYNGDNGYKFDTSSNQYQNSAIRDFLNRSTSWFFDSSIEQKLLLPTTIPAADSTVFDGSGNNVNNDWEEGGSISTFASGVTFTNPGITGDKIFLLSAKEISTGKYGFYGATLLSKSRCSRDVYDETDTAGERCWLRSSVEGSSTQIAVINPVPAGITDLYEYTDGAQNVLPACYIDTSSIVYISPAKNGKLSGTYGEDALQTLSNSPTTEFKCTLKDTSLKLSISNVSLNQDIFTFEYEASGSGVNNLSAILYDKDNNIVSYGRVKDIKDSANRTGSASIRVPADYEAFGYKLEVFPENYRGDTYTDFVGESIEVEVTVPAADEYTATFNGNGGTDGSSIIKKSGEELGTLPGSSKVGYRFLGWYTDITNGDKILETTQMPASDITYYAHWEREQYTISYELDEGINHVDNPNKYTFESEDILLKEPTKDGYTFLGWTYDGQTAPQKNVTIEKGSTGHKTYTANWSIQSHHVTFDSGNIRAQLIQHGQYAVKPASPSRDGYQFVDWYSDSNYQNKWNFNQNQVLTDITLYAKWDIINYNIDYQLAGGSNSSQNPYSYTVTSPDIFLKSPYRAGYVFKGWTYAGQQTPQTEVIIHNGETGDKKFVAHWAIGKYYVSFNSCGGSSIESQSLDHNSKLQQVNSPTRYGYRFAGWYTDQKYQNAWDFETGLVNDDFTLYAKWEPIQYTVIFKDKDGSILKQEMVNMGQKAVPPHSPSLSGYQFKGWDKSLEIIESDMIYTAVYEKRELKDQIITAITGDETSFIAIVLLLISGIVVVSLQFKKKR